MVAQEWAGKDGGVTVLGKNSFRDGRILFDRTGGVECGYSKQKD
jgi:hypothetical protein